MRIRIRSLLRSCSWSVGLGVFLFFIIQMSIPDSRMPSKYSRKLASTFEASVRVDQTVLDLNNSKVNVITPPSFPIPGDAKPGKPPFANGVRTVVCNNCFPHNYRYIINEPDLCRKFGTPPVVLMLITSRVSTNESRQLMRETWLKSIAHYPGRVTYAFTLGSIDNDTIMEEVRQESDIYHDIIQEDFHDSYRNLTLKTVMTVKWASTFCSGARYLMKTDEDMFINVPQLLNFLRTAQYNFSQTIVGSCNKEMTEPYRSPESKYHVTYEEYMFDWYPPFCSGTAYVMGLPLARQLYALSPNIPSLPLEDVYLGLIMYLLGYKVEHYSMFKVWPLSLRIEFYCQCIISCHDIPDKKKRIIWNEFHRQGCHNFIRNDFRVRCPRETPIVRRDLKHRKSAGKNLLIAFMIMFTSLFFFAILFILLLRHAAMA